MKHRTCILTLIALALLWGAPAVAQVTGPRFQVPFKFNIGQQQLPAGEYRLSAVDEKALLIRQIDGNQAIVAMTRARLEKSETNGRLELVFNCYEKTCFLSQAWLNTSSGRELVRSAEESEYARSMQRGEEVIYASNH